MVGEANIFTAHKAFLVRALRKFRESNGVMYQATANNTINGTFVSVVCLVARYRSLYHKPVHTYKGPLLRR